MPAGVGSKLFGNWLLGGSATEAAIAPGVETRILLAVNKRANLTNLRRCQLYGKIADLWDLCSLVSVGALVPTIVGDCPPLTAAIATNSHSLGFPCLGDPHTCIKKN